MASTSGEDRCGRGEWEGGSKPSSPEAAPNRVGKPGVWKEVLLQFMLWKSVLFVGSPACAFAGIKMLYRCKGDSKANWLPQGYYLVRFVQQGNCHPPDGQGPYTVLLLLWVRCCPEAAAVQRTVMPQHGTPQLQIPCALWGDLDTDPCRHPGSLVLLINQILKGWL